MTTENIDPEIELRRIQTVVLARQPDERGQLMGAAVTEHGQLMTLILNTN